MFTNYVQVINLVQGFNLQWPPAVRHYINSLSQISDPYDSFYSFSCIMHLINFDGFNHHYL